MGKDFVRYNIPKAKCVIKKIIAMIAYCKRRLTSLRLVNGLGDKTVWNSSSFLQIGQRLEELAHLLIQVRWN